MASRRCTFPEISRRRSFLEPGFRYLSPGSEGEKCRPHLVWFITQRNSSICVGMSQVFLPCDTYEYVLLRNTECVLQLRVRKWKETKSIARLRVLRVPIQLWGQVSKRKCKKTKSKRDIIYLQGLKLEKSSVSSLRKKRDKKQALSLSL